MIPNDQVATREQEESLAVMTIVAQAEWLAAIDCRWTPKFPHLAEAIYQLLQGDYDA